MAVYKTDRQRRILGDRLVARGRELAAIHAAVAEVHRGFTDVHGAFKTALEERQREDGEGAVAREKRDEAVAGCARLYSWAYHQVDAQPSSTQPPSLKVWTLEIPSPPLLGFRGRERTVADRVLRQLRPGNGGNPIL
jgi:hypothetical protein